MQKIVFVVIVAQVLFMSATMSQIKGEASKNKPIPYRPKLAEFSYQQLYEYESRSTSGIFGNSRSEIDRDRQLKIRLGVPVIINESGLFGLQLKYDHQNFSLDFEDTPAFYELYNHLATKSFTSLGARFIMRKSLNNNSELTVIAGGEIKSDRLAINENTMKYYAHFGYTKQLNSRTQMGGGIFVGYSLGSPQLYPLFIFEHQINNKWALDLKLPKQIAIRYKASDKFYVTAITEVKGWRYAIHNNELSPDDALVLRKTDIHFGLCFEHEIHDWLWFGVDMGLSKNFRSFLAAPGDNRWDAVIDITPRDAPYVKVGLFMVPPAKFYGDR